jgi:signal recognition particle receptor subunit beta
LAFINVKNKEVLVKIVYYGPGRGGKTTNLSYIHKTFREQIKSEMVSLKTYGDRTLFFDFLPFGAGKVRGFDLRIQLFTVPGQVKYNITRKLVLKGVDGVVFVADVQKEQRENNVEALNNLYTNLLEYNLDIFKIPLVLQYNKMDLIGDPNVQLLDPELLQSDLNSRLQAPAFTSSALAGGNVAATLKKIIMLTVASIQEKLN